MPPCLLKSFYSCTAFVAILASLAILSDWVIHSNSRILDIKEPRSVLYGPKSWTRIPLQEGVLEGNMNEVQTEAQKRPGRTRKAKTLVPEVEHLKQLDIQPSVTVTENLDVCRKKVHLDFLDKDQAEKLYHSDRFHSFMEGCENAICHFIDGRDRSPVCLKSYPGSGNTWMRGLLEKASGICTGSIYYDRLLVKQGFVGEHVSNGTVLVYKAHGMNISPQTKSLVLIIRNPFDALIAEWKRKNTGRNHTGIIDKSNFGTNSDWDIFVKMGALSWSRMARTMIRNFSEEDRKLLIVRFEDIKSDRAKEVKRVLEFTGITINQTEIESQLQDDFSAFKRNHDEEKFDHYTSTQRNTVKKAIVRVIEVIKERFPSDFNLREYLT